jgi:hypothetical protein
MSAERSPVRPGGAGVGPLGREPEMREDPADHPGILNGRDEHSQTAAEQGPAPA